VVEEEPKFPDRPGVARFTRSFNGTAAGIIFLILALPMFLKSMALAGFAALVVAVVFGVSAFRWSPSTNLKLVIGMLTLLVSLGAMETVIRLKNRLRHVEDMKPDPVLYWAPVPGSTIEAKDWHARGEFGGIIRYNIQGMRSDRDYAVPKKAGTFRVLLLGDSFVEARQVPLEKTFGSMLEKQLGTRADVINAGVTSLGAMTEYLHLRERCVSLQPDFVLQFFFMNDVSDDYFHNRYAYFDTSGELLGVRWPNLAPERQSRNPFSLVVDSVWEAFEYSATARQMRILRMRHELNWVPPEKGDVGTCPFGILKENYTEFDEAQWDRTKRYLQKSSDLAAKKGARYILICIPIAVQVGENQWTTGREVCGFPGTNVISCTNPQSVLQSFCGSKGILFLDLLPTFRKNASEKLYFDYDGHFNEAGHRVTARALYEFLVQQRLIPE
jgi:lysophospholipase L1-like esterase